MSNNPVIRMSSLCRAVSRDGQTVQIEIYEGDDGKWILEVVDEFNNSTVWNDQFNTDQQALDEAHKTITEEGIESLIGPPASPPH